MRNRSFVLAAVVASVAVLALAAARGGAQDVMRVFVENFPAVQRIQGNVTVIRPVPSSQLLRRDAVVAPVLAGDVDHLVDGGTIDASGFTYVTLSLAGALRGTGQAGAVGAILVPEEADVLQAMSRYGAVQFPLRVDTTVQPTPNGVFSSASATYRLAFPRYHVFYFNSAPKAADVTLYAFLSNS